MTAPLTESQLALLQLAKRHLFLSTSNAQAQQADARKLLDLGLVEALEDGFRITAAGASALIATRSKDELGGQ